MCLWQLSAGYIAAAVQRRLDSLAVPSIHTMRSKEGANVRHAVGIANIPGELMCTAGKVKPHPHEFSALTSLGCRL